MPSGTPEKGEGPEPQDGKRVGLPPSSSLEGPHRKVISAVAGVLRDRESIPESLHILGISVKFSKKGDKVKLVGEGGERSLEINAARFASHEEALRFAALQAAYLKSLQDELGKDTVDTLDAIKTSGGAHHQTLRLRGIRALSQWEKGLSEKIFVSLPASLTFSQQFDVACEQYLLTGKVSDGVSADVQRAFEKLRRGSSHVLDAITDERRSFRNILELYTKYVLPLRTRLVREEAAALTEREDYVPPPFRGEQEPLDPESVRWKVEPFLGGYYRQQVFGFDPRLGRLVAESARKFPFQPADLPENLDELKRYTFKGIFNPGEENNFPFPKTGLPFSETLTPKGMFRLMRSEHGVFSLDLVQELSEPVSFEFTFVLAKSADNRIDDEPSEKDLQVVDGPLDEEGVALVDGLRQNQLVQQHERSRAVVASTRKRLIYPEENEMEGMDARYAAAGNVVAKAIGDEKLADCHWSNIYASQLGRRLEIPWRIPGGYFVRKMKDVDFAAIGGTGHVWTEYYDPLQAWVQSDATPKKRNQEEDDEEQEQAEGPAMDGDMKQEERSSQGREEGSVESEGGMELTDEQIEKIAETMQTSEDPEDHVADELFEQRTGVSAKDWKDLESLISKVNTLLVPKALQIPERGEWKELLTAPRGTLQREWQKLFCLICDRRAIPRRAFRGPVRQSEGTRLRDITEAAIDVLAGDPDPGGYEVEAKKEKQKMDVSGFEEDAIVDLTSSMDDADKKGNSMKGEQKKLVMTLLHHLMTMNRRLNDSRQKTRMRNPLGMFTEVLSILGGGDKNTGHFSHLKKKDEPLSEETLVHLARSLDKTAAGAGDLLGALRAYRSGITADMQNQLKKCQLVKMLTIYSDGNQWCANCGSESHQNQIDSVKLKAMQDEVKALRAMGIIVQGIGFTDRSKSIELICRDPEDKASAVIVEDVSKAVFARYEMLSKHLKRL